MTERDISEDAKATQAREIEALRQATLRSWWWVCLALWLTVGAVSLWWLRSDLQELREYFTWAAVRYMLAYGRLAAVGLGLCVGLTLALLVGESRHILFGLSVSERDRLTAQLNKIHAQGPSHPQWKVIQPTKTRLED
ncbi:MAG: hypothetical protein HC800_11925 [Phormidesmis sp. RL_2_1]|nr:hypothetical protein [Phormidesmis sp. RL_2_1]